MKNEILEDAISILHQAGIEPRVVRSKHWKLIWTDERGQARLFVVSFSPSSRRTRIRSRATLRRLLAP